MAKKHFPKGLDGCIPDEDGKIHKKREDTFPMLATVLKRKDIKTLTQLLHTKI